MHPSGNKRLGRELVQSIECGRIGYGLDGECLWHVLSIPYCRQNVLVIPAREDVDPIACGGRGILSKQSPLTHINNEQESKETNP